MKTHLNLLPQSYRRRRLIRERLLAWCVVWGVAAALACGVFWVKYQQYNSQLAQKNARESEYEPIRDMRGELTVLRKTIAEFKEREALALSLADEQPVLAVVGIVSRAARQCQGELCVQHFSLSRQRLTRSAPSSPDSAATRSPRLLTLKGYSLNHPSVLSFVEGLRSEDVFDRVELKSSEVATMPSGVSARTYLVECVF